MGYYKCPTTFRYLSSGDCSPYFTYHIETKLRDFENNILNAALGIFSSCVATTLTGQTFIFCMLNIKASLKKLQTFQKSSIHRAEGLKVL